MRRLTLGLAAVLVASLPASAEFRVYGEVDLTGLSRESWPLNPGIPVQNAMVCNVNGPDGFLSIRSGPGTQYSVNRKLNRLAIIEVVPADRQGRWVRVINAYRTVTKDGFSQPVKDLPVQGWAHDGYLCDFIH